MFFVLFVKKKKRQRKREWKQWTHRRKKNVTSPRMNWPRGPWVPMSLRSVQAIDRVGTDQVKKKEIKTKDKKKKWIEVQQSS